MKVLKRLLATVGVVLTILGGTLFYSVLTADATWLPTEDFESYTIGNDLDTGAGGADWSGNWAQLSGVNEGEIVAAPSGMEGSNAVMVHWDSGDGGSYRRTLTAITEGSVSYQFLVATTDKDMRVSLFDTSIPITRASVRFASDGNIHAIGSADNSLGAYSASTTYTIVVKFGHTAGNFAVSLDGGSSFSSDYDMAGTGSQVDSIVLANENTVVSQMYVDDIKPYTASAASSDPIIKTWGGGQSAGGVMGW